MVQARTQARTFDEYEEVSAVYERDYVEWESELLPLEVLAAEEGVALDPCHHPGSDAQPILLTKRKEREKTFQPDELDALLDSIVATSTPITGKPAPPESSHQPYKDVATLLSEFQAAHDELRSYALSDLADGANRQEYQRALGTAVGVLDGLKHHYVGLADTLAALEEEQYRRMEQKTGHLAEEQKQLGLDRDMYDLIRHDKTAGVACGSGTVLFRAESKLAAQIGQRTRRITTLEKSFAADRSVNYVLNNSLGRAWTAVERIEDMQGSMANGFALYAALRMAPHEHALDHLQQTLAAVQAETYRDSLSAALSMMHGQTVQQQTYLGAVQ